MYHGKKVSHPSLGPYSAAIRCLEAKGCHLAMLILDGIMRNNRVLQIDPSDVQALVNLTHEAGSLWCTNAVQGGHGWTGLHMWSFKRFGIVPVLAMMGKPMGNGHSIPGVVMQKYFAEPFVQMEMEGVFFSAFGGNPLSYAAAHTVLSVIKDKGVLVHTAKMGEFLRLECCRAMARIGCVGD